MILVYWAPSIRPYNVTYYTHFGQLVGNGSFEAYILGIGDSIKIESNKEVQSMFLYSSFKTDEFSYLYVLASRKVIYVYIKVSQYMTFSQSTYFSYASRCFEYDIDETNNTTY